MIRSVLPLFLILAAPALAQPAPETPAPAPAPAPVPALVRVTLTTPLGAIVLGLDKDHAPVTSAYFLKYVDQKRLDGSTFYRAYRITPDGTLGLVQGGVLDPRKLLPPVAHEPTSMTGLTHTEGAISLARMAPGTATANFFIILGDLSSLDAQPAGKGDPDGYAVFGRVLEGMDVVRKILAAPTSPTKGEGSLKGQIIEVPVPLLSARRTP
ncbi:peptidylprolyl isomerase [Sandarakinorhabdus sp.]|uniref:peptidylprolyl isomerase n=1 Tax=Sandarakinorhabdus sp. TaxID=1916663 RepID=UPI00286DA0FE|nr:peptidylprolyl isomerase [Sandarakinorhabdus sp.]